MERSGVVTAISEFPPAKVGGLIEANSRWFFKEFSFSRFRRQKSAASLKHLNEMPDFYVLILFPPAKVGGLIEAVGVAADELRAGAGFRRQKSAASLKL